MNRVIRQHLRRVVILTLKSGVAFRGILFQVDREAVVLRDCTLLEDSGTDRIPAIVDGELVVLRADIAYMQFT